VILAIALLLLAIVLVVLELSFPSFGMLGIGAATAYAFALIQAFKEGTTQGWTFVVLGVILLPLTIALGLRLVPLTPFGRRLFLPLPPAAGGTPGAAASAPSIGTHGVALSDLRPAGVAEFDGRRVDVVAGEGWVGRGTPIRVAAVERTRIVVEVRSPGTPTPPPSEGPLA
jgi:membrane-bound serine protease (ClpP class)